MIKCCIFHSEESVIRLICPDLGETWIPMGGEPVIGSLEKPLHPLKDKRTEAILKTSYTLIRRDLGKC